MAEKIEIHKSKIKAIVFDIGGVLALDAPKNFLGELLIKRDIPIQESLTAWRKYWPQFKLGNISEDEFWKGFVDELLIKERPEDLINEFKDMMRLFLVPIDDVFAYAKELKAKFRVGVISNNSREWIAYLQEHYEIDKDFEPKIYSYELHAVKPEKKVYEVMMTKLGVKPEEVVFVDNHERNLEPAKEMGMHVILFKDINQLKSELQKVIEGDE